MKYSRNDETQADAVGPVILYNAGYFHGRLLQDDGREGRSGAPRASDGSMIFMIFIAPEADYPQLQPTYEAMLKSVQFR
jgi:hypothetical protein